MKLLTWPECHEWLKRHCGQDANSLVDSLQSSDLKTLDESSGRLTHTARVVAEAWPCGPGQESLLIVLEYDVFPSCALPHLFERYRMPIEAPPSVEDFPGQLIGEANGKILEGLLALSLYFCWGVLLVHSSGLCRLLTSHDSWIAVQDDRPGRELCVVIEEL